MRLLPDFVLGPSGHLGEVTVKIERWVEVDITEGLAKLAHHLATAIT